MRKLASVQIISKLEPIEGKDRIELATVLGWHVIVQKGLYQIGDMCVFCEPDSLMPEREEFEFLRPKGFKIKTIKLSGVLSQGICFPLSILPSGTKTSEGMDVTDILGVKNYTEIDDAPAPKAARKRNRLVSILCKTSIGRKIVNRVYRKRERRAAEAAAFPSFIQKTDEERIQTVPHLIAGNARYIAREKVDGSSMTVFLKKKKKRFPWSKESFEYGVCSRNRRVYADDPTGKRYHDTAMKFNMEYVLRSLIGDDAWVAIQGEMIAPSIQGNKYKVKESDFYVFNLLTPEGIVPCGQGEELVGQLGLKWCPKVGVIECPMTVEEMLRYADGQSLINPDVLREGVVCRNYTYDGRRTSFKAVSPRFLLEHDKAKR